MILASGQNVSHFRSGRFAPSGARDSAGYRLRRFARG
jgi:hypothetical protein